MKEITNHDWLDTIFTAYNNKITPEQFTEVIKFINNSSDDIKYKKKYMNKLFYKTLKNSEYKDGVEIFENMCKNVI